MPEDICPSVTIRQNLILGQMRGKHTEEHLFYTNFLSDEQSSPVAGQTHRDFQLETLLLTMAFLPMHCCKNSYCCSELIQLCSSPQSGSCWLLQLLHF